MNQSVTSSAEAGKTANLIYILYLASLVVGITNIVGVVMAYSNRAAAPEWVQSHYTFQIRTFWISMLAIVVGMITAVFVVGFFILLAWCVWLIIRCVKGMGMVGKGEAHPNPTTWMW